LAAAKEEEELREDSSEESEPEFQSELSYGWDSEEELKVEPLPSSVYSSPPEAPTPPVKFEEFDYTSDSENWEPTELALSNTPARRSSQLGEERTVTEPPFLTAEWGKEDFPVYTTTNTVDEDTVDETQWDDHTIPCYRFQQWVNWVMKRPSANRLSWAIPSPLFTFFQPPRIEYPCGGYYRQQVFSNDDNSDWSSFAEPLRGDLVHHSRTHIPLVPTGRIASVDMKYLVEVLFEPSGQSLSLQLKDPKDGRLLKLDVLVSDTKIRVELMINHRRMNHVSNDEECEPWDDRYHYWDME
jgi:hypothetical protein